MRERSIEHLISLIFRISRLMYGRTSNSDHIDPLSFLRLEALRCIAERDTPTMKDVAQHLSVKPPSATALLNTLVRGGYVYRIADSSDRRRLHLVPILLM